MIFLGAVVVAAGVMTSSGVSSSGGGFILIGPFPILFGSGPDSATLSLVGAAITVVVVLFYVLSFMRWRRGRQP
jgi:uncharacterized membrane protein